MIAGIPSNILLAAGLRRFYTDEVSGYRGCMSSLVKNRKVVDLRDERLQDPAIQQLQSVVSGCREQPVCEASKCLHGCTCSVGQSFCDNSMIPFYGQFCENPDVGFEFYVDAVPGQVTLRYDPVETTTVDKISFGFITCDPNGLLAKLTGANSNEQIKIYMLDSAVIAEYRLGGPAVGRIRLAGPFNDKKLYMVQFVRNGRQADLTIINSQTGRSVGKSSTVISSTDTELNGLKLLEIGSEHNAGRYENGFKGVIMGFKHGNYPVFNLAKGLTRWTRIKQPGTKITSASDYSEEGSFSCSPISGDCGPGKPECQNFGVCQNNVCNCTLTAFTGTYCTDEPVGHYYGFNDWKAGIDIHEYPSAVSTDEDYFAVGLMTYEPNGTIFRVQNARGSQYYDLRLVNGKAQLEYRLGDRPGYIVEDRVELHSRDHVYHVIRMNRTGDTITFFVDGLQKTFKDPNIKGVKFEGQKILMAGGMMGRTNQIEDDWNGILAGLYYNNKFMYYPSVDSNSDRKLGDVEIAKHPFRLKFEPEPTCPECFHGGVHTADKRCDCTYTGYAGLCCNTQDGLFGFHTKIFGGDSTVIYNNTELVGRDTDDLSVSFRTAGGWPNGQIVRVESLDKSKYVIVEVVNDLVVVRYDLGGGVRNANFTTVNVRDQTDHTLRIHREGRDGYIKLDTITRLVDFMDGGIFDARVIYVGGAYNGTHATSGHYGIIWGVNFNGVDIVKKAMTADATKNGMSVVSEGSGNFNIVPYPWPALCEYGSVNTECSQPPPLVPTQPGGAGAVIPEIGVAPIAPAPVVAGGGGPAWTTTGAIIGAVMGGLLFSSAIAFAAAGMKPGFLALSKGFGGGAGKGAYVPVADGKMGTFPVSNGGSNYVVAVGMEEYGGAGSQAGSRSQYEDSFTHESRFDATDTSLAGGAGGAGGAGSALLNGTGGGGGGGAGGYNTYNSSSWYTRNEMTENQAGYGGGSTIGGYGGGRPGYAGSVAGGSVAGSVYGFGTVTNPDQAFITLSEDIAVDNVVLTGDGRYVVTGSNLGPPQVWNTTVRLHTIAII